MTSSPYYIIEHPLRGILMEQDFEGPSNTDYTTKWAWSKPRSEAMRFFNLPDAIRVLKRLPFNIQETAQVLSSTDWQPVELP